MNNQRTLVTLEQPVRELIEQLAKEKGISISSLCRELICEGLDILEDRYFDSVASERDKKFDWENSLTHEEVWNKK